MKIIVPQFRRRVKYLRAGGACKLADGARKLADETRKLADETRKLADGLAAAARRAI
jgi:X-X-X-Leu-X-X-Gly heptad repeat protein